MSLVADTEKEVAAAVTGRAWAKLAIYAVAAILVIALLWICIHRLFFAGREAQQQHANDVVQTGQAAAAAEGSAKAVETVRQVHDEYHRIDLVTRRNEDAITHATGAEATAPDVARALHDALCLRDAYRGEPDCAGVQPAAEGIGAAGADAGRLPAERR